MREDVALDNAKEESRYTRSKLFNCINTITAKLFDAPVALIHFCRSFLFLPFSNVPGYLASVLLCISKGNSFAVLPFE